MIVYQPHHDASEWVELNPLEFRSAAIVGVWIWEKSHANGHLTSRRVGHGVD